MNSSRPTTGRAALFALVLGLVAGCATPAQHPSAAPAPAARPAAFVTEIATTVADLDASTRFFVDTLGAEVLGTEDVAGAEVDALLGVSDVRLRVRALRLGAERLSLLQVVAPAGAPARTGARSNDLDFQHIALVVRDMDAMHTRVTPAGVASVSVGGPQRIPDTNPAAAGIRAFYFRDRDQRALELIWYPADKGDPRWHATAGPLLLGVDHTAIAVADTGRSRAFYEGEIGLQVRGESLNEGVEQAALSGVDGARVRITGLGGPSGPGVELLEYEQPGPGAAPPPRAPTAVGYWETTVHVPDLDATIATLRASGATPVSRRVGRCQTCSLGQRAMVFLDPDGHAVRVSGD
ncbi:MAG: glyoxalase [Deltaproteobacteria bacterium HGW-Deltaproteobacteria-14]|jgi:catechol 2,3-dioxygenase-like lactoylglutathione lyase family enzyme|nr:MAG: glyoxalase [Deltaproteobacteria bacterium HGW-Deltaproteobacteria-14]